MHTHLTIYLAGPLFTQAERRWNVGLASELKRRSRNIDVLLPQEETKRAISHAGIDFTRVKEICLEGLDYADVVVAILDGADADSGTCFECGYAYAKGKRLIGVRTDIRSHEDKGLNAMLRQSCDKVIEFPAFEDDEENLQRLADKILVEVKAVKNVPG
jgi:nucleoside 2-deoxyribosyltransferase